MINGNSVNKNEIIKPADFNGVYILAEHEGEIDEIVFLCRFLGVTPLSYRDRITSLLEDEGLAVRHVSRKARNYKREINRLSSKCILLFSDTSSAYANYLARNSNSIIIFSKSLTSVNKSYYYSLASYSNSCGCLMNRLHELFGFTEKLYGIEIHGILSCRVYDLLKYLYYKFRFGFRTGYADLPGLYAQKVLVPTQEIKDVYLEHGFSDDKINVTGSFYEDLYTEIYERSIPVCPPNEIDVLFFSQPMYMYLEGKEDWIAEVEALVEDCYSEGLNLTILLHPRDDHHYYEHLEGKATLVSGKRLLSDNIQYVLRSKLVVIKSSTTHLIPLVCNVPVAYLNYNDVFPLVDMAKSFRYDMILTNNNMLANVFESISTATGKILKNQREYLKTIGKFDNQSTNRVRDLILKTIS